MSCAAAPIIDASGRLVGAFSVSGPAFRLDPDTLESRIVPLLVAAGAELSRVLGCPS
jgi:DNA-binding IclR family transcriptional regulator